MSADKVKAKSILRWLPGVLISLVAIYFLLKFISLDDLLAAVKSLTALDIAVIVLLNVLSFLARSMGWKNLLEGISFKQAFLIINEGYLFNNLIPRSGEIVRMLLVGGLSKISTFQAASSILVERSLDVIVAAVLFLSTLPLAVEMTWIKPIAWTLFILFIVMIAVMMVSGASCRFGQTMAGEFKDQVNFIKRKDIPQYWICVGWFSDFEQSVEIRAQHILDFDVLVLLDRSAVFRHHTHFQRSGPALAGRFSPRACWRWASHCHPPQPVLAFMRAPWWRPWRFLAIPKAHHSASRMVLHFTQIVVTSIFGVYGLMVQGQSISRTLRPHPVAQGDRPPDSIQGATHE